MSLVWDGLACMAFWGMCVKLWLLSFPKSFATNYWERAVELLDRYEAQCPAEKAEILAFLKGGAAKGEDEGSAHVVAVVGGWVSRESGWVEPMWKAAAKKWDSGEV